MITFYEEKEDPYTPLNAGHYRPTSETPFKDDGQALNTGFEAL